MSRHRTVRSKNFSDEYDGLDDCFGHSVEDDFCVSPSAEQFMYDRSKQPNIASFMTEPDIVEGVEEVENLTSSYKVPHLSEIDTAKLMSCVETIRNVVGDTIPESELKRKIIEFGFNTEAVLNAILNHETANNITVSESTSQMAFENQPGSKLYNSFDNTVNTSMFNTMNSNVDQKCNLGKECDKNGQEFSPFSNMFTKTANPLEIQPNPNSLNSFAGLSAFHQKMSAKKSNFPSAFSIPKVNFNNHKPSEISRDECLDSLAEVTARYLKISNDNKPSGYIIPKLESDYARKDQNDISSFDSLAELTAHHLNISNDNNISQETFVSPSRFVIPKIGTKNNESRQSSSPSFNSIAKLTAHHLNTSNDNNDSQENVISPSCFVIPNNELKQSSSPLFSSLAELTAHHLKISNQYKNDNVPSSGMKTLPTTDINVKPSLESFSNIKIPYKNVGDIDARNQLTTSNPSTMNEKCLEDSICFSKAVFQDVSNLPLEEYANFNSPSAIKTEKKYRNRDLKSNPTTKTESIEFQDPYNVDRKPISLESSLIGIKEECNIYRDKAIRHRKLVSSFGRVLCKNFSRKTPYPKITVNSTQTITPFDFSSPSPDSIILERMRNRMVS